MPVTPPPNPVSPLAQSVQPSSDHASTATPAQAMPLHGLLEMGWAGAGPSDELRTGMELLARTAWAGLGWDWVGPVWVRWTG